MPVIGGSGLFRFARGYVQARTHNFDPKTGDATVQYNVIALKLASLFEISLLACYCQSPQIALFLSSIIGTINSHECAVVSKSISKISINIINNSSMTIWIQSTQKLSALVYHIQILSGVIFSLLAFYIYIVYVLCIVLFLGLDAHEQEEWAFLIILYSPLPLPERGIAWIIGREETAKSIKPFHYWFLHNGTDLS
ncbi:hypothetical protein CUMW_269160 [Citrus unshiu]|uniref:Dirigent protein n=1 Tax=Citrus unshiu TaxID=55188 RepID=A0A2H5QWR9_CITUN|nr:hypothetical protein CUMW_269160 [Citrus unshiu]